MYLITYSSSSGGYNPLAWFIMKIDNGFLSNLQHAEDIVSIAANHKNFLAADFRCESGWFTDQDLEADLDIEVAKNTWLSKCIEWESNPNGEAEQADYFTLNNEGMQFVLSPAHTDNLRVYSENIQPAELREWLNKTLSF